MAVFAGLALLTAIFDTQAQLTTKYTTTNESHDVTFDASTNVNTTLVYEVTDENTGWKISGCPLTSVTVGLGNGTVFNSSDYVFTESIGNFTLLNSTNTLQIMGALNQTFVTYTWCPDGYNKDGSSRSIAGLIGLFAALGLIGYVISFGIKEWL